MARINQVQYVNFYTAGSAAYQFEPAPVPKKKASLPKYRRKKRIKVFVDPLAIAGTLLAVVMMIMMISGMFRLISIHRQEAQMQAYVQQLQEENTQLKAQYHAGYDSEEIRQIASAMGMVTEDEIQHIQVQMTPPQAEEDPTAWERICTFLTGLFA